MKAFQEITEWDTDFTMPNHVYFLSDSKDKMYAYVKRNTETVTEFKKPYRFDSKGRKFTEIENTFGYKKPEVEVKLGKEYKVPGSANNVYVVREHLGEWTCTCPASKYQKGECKHVAKLKLSN